MTIDMDRRFGPGSDRGFFIVMAALVVAAVFGPSYAASQPAVQAWANRLAG